MWKPPYLAEITSLLVSFIISKEGDTFPNEIHDFFCFTWNIIAIYIFIVTKHNLWAGFAFVTLDRYCKSFQYSESEYRYWHDVLKTRFAKRTMEVFFLFYLSMVEPEEIVDSGHKHDRWCYRALITFICSLLDSVLF